LINDINNALEFTGILKIPFYRSSEESYKQLYKSAAWFPITGLLLGLLFFFINQYFSLNNEFQAIIFVFLYSIITRATHIDGFVDCCDAFFGGYDEKRRLDILKDSNIGVFAGCGLFFLLYFKYMLYKYLIINNMITYILISMILSRNLFIYVAIGANYPREKGTGKIFVENISFRELIISIILCLTFIFFIPKVNLIKILILYVFLTFLSFIFRIYCKNKISGVTGDCLGAWIEICEVLFMSSIFILA